MPCNMPSLKKKKKRNLTHEIFIGYLLYTRSRASYLIAKGSERHRATIEKKHVVEEYWVEESSFLEMREDLGMLQVKRKESTGGEEVINEARFPKSPIEMCVNGDEVEHE